MEKLKVAFLDFWPEINDENIFLPILQKHFDVEVTKNNPDIVIHSIFNRMQETPKYNCKKILFLGENYRPSQFPTNYSISFDPHSETNFRLPLWQLYLIFNPLLKDKLFNKIKHNIFNEFFSFTVSNGGNVIRNGFYYYLTQYKKVRSYGKIKTNDLSLQRESQGKYWRDAKDAFFIKNTHKFSIVFENNSYPYYTTEKLMDAFLAGSIPIYWGDPKVNEDWNSNAFINVGKIGTENAIQLIKEMDNNDGKFAKMYNEPVFTKEQKNNLEYNINRFEDWLIEIIKK